MQRLMKFIMVWMVLAWTPLISLSHVWAASSAISRTFLTHIDGQKTWVTVVRRGMQQPSVPTNTWWQWGNVTSDAYLFQFGIKGQVRLILSFLPLPGGREEANFYANRLGKLPIRYRLTQGHLTIQSEHGYPYIVLKTDHGRWLSQGKTNYNLTMLIDGLISVGPQKIMANGHPNALIRVGQTVPGVPQWETTTLLYDPHKSWGYPRFGAEERLPNAPVFRTMPPLMPGFPYFTIGNGKFNWYHENPSPLYYSLPAAQLLTHSFVGFENAGNYQVNSLLDPPSVDFESPFAFYNFVPNSRYSQLVVRSESFPANDPFGPDASVHRKRTSFRYSWAGSNPRLWSYSLQLAGSIAFRRSVQIGGIRFKGIAPRELPSWVTEQRWPLVSFVQAMKGYAGSEGIYEYTPQIPQAWPWLLGGTTKPAEYWQHPYLSRSTGTAHSKNRYPGETLAAGFRGEYNAADFRQPRLYISPVDGLVHLAWAQSGVWNLGRGWYVRTESLNHGPYVDAWMLKQVRVTRGDPQAKDGLTKKAFYNFGHYMLYSGQSRVIIRRVSMSVTPVVLDPPTNAASWHTFNAVAKKAQTGRSPWSMVGWLSAFPGQTLSLPGARILSVVESKNLFDVVVHLSRPVKVPHVFSGLRNLKAGTDILAYNVHRGSWAEIPVVKKYRVAVHYHVLPLGRPTTTVVTIANRGNVASIFQVSAMVGHHLYQRRSTVAANSVGTVRFSWQPSNPGRYPVTVRVNGRVESTHSMAIKSVGRTGFFFASLPGTIAAWVTGALVLLLSIGISMAWLGRGRPNFLSVTRGGKE